MDILDREGAPLSKEQWGQLDEVVVSAARKSLVGRRLVPLLGPLGAGQMVVPQADLEGLDGDEPISVGPPRLVALEQIHQDFVVDWQELAAPERMGLPVSWAAAAAAAELLARREDDIIFHGSKTTGQKGLLTAAGAHQVAKGDWSQTGALLADYAQAVGALAEAGFPGPLAMVVSPGTYAMAHRPMGGGQLEIGLIRQQAEAGVLASRMLGPEQALVMAPGKAVADLAIGLDMTTAYLGADEMKHPFRVMETLALRIKRSQGIAVIG